MSDMIERASERLSKPTSRRHFLAVAGKAAIGLAAGLVGAASLHTAYAGGCMGSGPLCCTGGGCPGGVCPPNTKVTYTWLCCYQGVYIDCSDCTDSSGNCQCVLWYNSHEVCD